MSTERYRGLDRKWTVLAYINLFIMHLKAKLRKRQQSVSSNDTNGAHFCSKSLLPDSPKMLKRNNWMTTGDEKASQKSTNNTRNENDSIIGGGINEATPTKHCELFERLRFTLKKLFKFHTDNSVDVENHSSGVRANSIHIDPTPIEVNANTKRDIDRQPQMRIL